MAMNNLKRLIWLMTDSMRLGSSSHGAMVFGMHYAQLQRTHLFAAIYCDDLPFCEECRRIMKITSAFNSAVYAFFEKDAIRRVVRRHGDFEPLIAEMERALLELKAQESRRRADAESV